MTAKSSDKGSNGEEYNKEFIHSEHSNDDRMKKKESSLGNLPIEHFQSLTTNVVKAM